MKTTTDHNEIKQWSEQHHGKPALIDDPKAFGDKQGIRLDFPGHADEALLSDSHPSKDISWDEFFKIFDDQHLEFRYEPDADGGDPTSWYRFARQDN